MASITNINGNNTVLIGSTGNTLVVAGYGTLTSLTIGGKAATNLVGSGANYTFDLPGWVDGVAYPAVGSVTATAGDGTLTANLTVTLSPATNYAAPVTITSVAGTGEGYIQSYITVAVNDLVYTRTPASYAVTTNRVTALGLIQIDYIGTQYVWVRNNSTGVMTRLSLYSGVDNIPDAFSFTALTNKPMNTPYESAIITVAGVDTGVNIPISITGGTYSVNTGSGFGAYTASAGNVQVGHQVKIKGVSSASYNTTTTVTLSLGPTQGSLTITSSIKGVVNLSDWIRNVTSSPVFDCDAITGGH